MTDKKILIKDASVIVDQGENNVMQTILLSIPIYFS